MAQEQYTFVPVEQAVPEAAPEYSFVPIAQVAPEVTPTTAPPTPIAAPPVTPALEKDKYEFAPISELTKGFTGGVLNAIPAAFSNKESAMPKTVPRETVAEERPDLGSPMGESFISELANSGVPKRQSVLESKQLPPTKETQDKYVLDPKFTNAIEAQLNSIPEDERQAKLDKLAMRPDVYGRAAKLIQQRYENYNATTQPTISKAFDPRLEAQTERFMEQGANAETAQAEASRQARRGQIGRNLAQVTETPEDVQEGMGYKLPTNATPIEQTLNTIQRGAKLGLLGGETAIRGTHRFIGDMLGMDLPGFDTKKNLDRINAVTQGMGENPNKPLQIVEGAISSISQQLPYMIAGVATGSEAAVLVPMFANAFGQNYDEARRAGLSTEDSTIRSTFNSIFEVLGEKVGLGSEMKALKASTKGIPTSELFAYYTKALARDVPGEELTYTGQLVVDKVLGLNPDMDFKGFLKGAAETMLATVTQGSLMMAGGAGINKAVRTLAGPQQEQTQQEQQQEAPLPPSYAVQPTTYQKGYGDTRLNVIQDHLKALPPAEQADKISTYLETSKDTEAATSVMSGALDQSLGADANKVKQTAQSILGSMGEVRPGEDKNAPTTEDTVLKTPSSDETTIKQLIEDHVAAGIPRIDAEELAKRDVKGMEHAGLPVTEPSGTSAGVPNGTPAVSTTTGAGAPTGDGVVSTRPNVGEPNVGEGQASTAVNQTEKPNYAELSYEQLLDAREQADEINNKLDIDAVRKHYGDEQAKQYEAMTASQRRKWWVKMLLLLLKKILLLLKVLMKMK